jgi:hypothetical protein
VTLRRSRSALAARAATTSTTASATTDAIARRTRFLPPFLDLSTHRARIVSLPP